jgi:hypothetical protein
MRVKTKIQKAANQRARHAGFRGGARFEEAQRNSAGIISVALSGYLHFTQSDNFEAIILTCSLLHGTSERILTAASAEKGSLLSVSSEI